VPTPSPPPLPSFFPGNRPTTPQRRKRTTLPWRDEPFPSSNPHELNLREKFTEVVGGSLFSPPFWHNERNNYNYVTAADLEGSVLFSPPFPLLPGVIVIPPAPVDLTSPHAAPRTYRRLSFIPFPLSPPPFFACELG